MKKVFLLVAAVFASYFAQAQDGGGVKLGIKAGANFSNWAGDDAKTLTNLGLGGDPEYKLGLHAGLFADFGISDMVSIRPEALYSMKGFKVEANSEDTNYKTTYIDVPILAHIKADGLFFELGPTASYLLSAKEENEDSDTDGFKKLDIGYAAGIGYETTSGVGIGLRYNGGLSKLTDEEDIKIRNSNFQLSLSYTFGGM